MSRRTARTGALLLAGLLLALFGIAGVATAQENERLKVDFRETTPGKGKIGITVAMSGDAWDPSLQLTQDDFSATIDGNQVDITGAAPLGAQPGSQGQLAVILAVDTSGSMRKNNNIAKARSAAARFAAGMPPGTRLGVLSFGTQTKLEQELTTDRARVQAVIQNLEAEVDGGTALYDAVVQGSGLLAGEKGQTNLVVLSDGRHEGTATTLQQAIKAAKGKARVTAVALDAGFPQDKAALAGAGRRNRRTDAVGLRGEPGARIPGGRGRAGLPVRRRAGPAAGTRQAGKSETRGASQQRGRCLPDRQLRAPRGGEPDDHPGDPGRAALGPGAVAAGEPAGAVRDRPRRVHRRADRRPAAVRSGRAASSPTGRCASGSRRTR